MFGRIVVASVVAEIASSRNARGYADLDWTALGLIAAEEAGIKATLSPAQRGM